MALHLVTGYKGKAHITSADQGLFNAVSLGTEDYVFTTGKQFEAQVINSNTVRIFDGALMMNGRFVTLETGTYLDATIANGTSGMKRHDIIGIRYEINSTSGVESVSLSVTKGTATASTPSDPINGYPISIVNGATVRDMWLYRVVLNGLNIEKVEPLFTVLAPLAKTQHSFYKQNLLLNGDFQCNQRGKKTYDKLTSATFTVDMWRGYLVKVNVLNEGITLTGSSSTEQGYFTQFIQLGKLVTTTYTICAMADDKLCTFTVTPGATAKEKSFGTFKISALTTSVWSNDLNDYDNKLKINICPIGTNATTFKYIDVFEGVVAYPHVKEDPATALMRCRRYIQAGSNTSPFFWNTLEIDRGDVYSAMITFDTMARRPQVDSCTATYYALASAWQTATYKLGDSGANSIVVNTAKQPATDAILLEISMAPHERCSGVHLKYVLSCEPDEY